MCHTPTNEVRDKELREAVLHGTLPEADSEFEAVAAKYPLPEKGKVAAEQEVNP